MAIENKKDKDLTKLARRTGLIHSPSWISYAGHVYLKWPDRGILRDRVAADQKYICALCKTYCSDFDGDLDHIVGGRPVARCDCYNTLLADGTRHTNVRFVHGMFAKEGCHRTKHNREPKWSKK